MDDLGRILIPMDVVFTAGDMKRETGASCRQIDRLARTGRVVPSISRAQGKGTRRVYAARDVLAMKLGLALRERTNDNTAFDRVVRFVQGSEVFETTEDVAGKLLVVTADEVRLASPADLPPICLHAGAPVIVLPIGLSRVEQ